MLIEWNIIKKRGNIRPVLTYSVRLEDHEKALALPGVSIVSAIPKPEEDRQEYCYPGQFERGPGASRSAGMFHELEAPSHRGHSWTHSLRLPWREGNQYPEVEAAFRLLREAVERELERAADSAPLRVQGALRTSQGAKQGLAPAVLAERLLKSAARMQGAAGEA